MGDDLVIVLEFHPEGGVGEEFRHHSRKFEHFFLRHKAPSQSKSGGEWSGETAKSRTIPKRSKDGRLKRPAQSASHHRRTDDTRRGKVADRQAGEEGAERCASIYSAASAKSAAPRSVKRACASIVVSESTNPST